MTIEQEALAIFAAGLAAFLDQAVARLDEPGPKPVEIPHSHCTSRRRWCGDPAAGYNPCRSAA
jgi:hypothetical protein